MDNASSVFIGNLNQNDLKEIPLKTPLAFAVQKAPNEIIALILSHLLLITDFFNTMYVSQAWKKISELVLSKKIKGLQVNETKTTMIKIFQYQKKNLGSLVVHYFRIPELKDYLQYANFSYVKGFRNEELELLLANCLNIKHLILRRTEIHGNALSSLRHNPSIETLNISLCAKLAENSLQYLKHVPNLLTFDISECYQLSSNLFTHLKDVPKLQHLTIKWCIQLDSQELEKTCAAAGLLNLKITC